MQSWVMKGRTVVGRRSGRTCTLALAAALLIALLTVTPARAATSYRPADSFGWDLTSAVPTAGIAVDHATGHIFVVDADHVNVYESPGGSTPTLLTTITGLQDPQAIAIDQLSSAIYVADAGANQILRYTSDGAAVPLFTRDLAYFSPAFGSGASDIGDFRSPMAIDPRNGDLLVGDRANLRVSRYSSAGAFIASFTGGATKGGAFGRFLGLAADDAGDVYLTHVIREGFPAPTSASALEHFAADGTLRGRVAGVDEGTLAVAFDAKTRNVVVSGRARESYDFDPPPPLLHVLHDGVLIDSVEYPAGTGNSSPSGLAVDAGGSGRVYALTRMGNFGGITSVQVFAPALLPDVSTQAPTDVTSTAATFQGTIDPLGEPGTSAFFEYSVDDGATWKATSPVPVGGAGPVEIRETGLAPNTAYRVRLVGENANGRIASQPSVAFSTAVAPPGVVTGPATDRTDDGATLRGTVNPYGLQATYWFEYGVGPQYGTRAPAAHENVVGNGRAPRQVSVGIADLVPGTTYHYRLVARTSAGVAYGDDRTFVTRPGPDSRRFEQVSPAVKGGSQVNPRMTFRSSADGNRISYRWRAAPSEALAAPRFPQSVATRGGEGWTTNMIDPPQLPRPSNEQLMPSVTLSFSEDMSRAIVASRRKLAEGATEGRNNLYLRNIDTGAYTWMATGPQSTLIFAQLGSSPILSASRDFSHVLLGGLNYPLLPGAPSGALYEWTGGQLKVASVGPDGTVVGDVESANYLDREQRREPRWMSADGSRVFFSQTGGPLLARLDGNRTMTISASARAGETGVAKPAQFAGASADGNVVFFAADALTDDAPAAGTGLYRYEMETGELRFLTPIQIASPLAFVQTSENGASTYFYSDAVLVPEALAGKTNLYVWHDGSVRLIASLDQALDPSFGNLDWMASPNGRYFAFTAYTELTGYDNATTTACNVGGYDVPGVDACRQAYRYDVSADELVCVSCRPDGRAPTGNAHLGESLTLAEGDPHRPRSVLDNGMVVFDTSEPLSARDRNDSRDVYAFDGADVALISGGEGGGSSELAEVSPDGGTIFFTTDDRLAGSDDDNATDLYAARVAGGFSAQDEPERGQEQCLGEDCRGAGNGPVDTPNAPSEAGKPTRGAPVKPGKATVRVTTGAFTGTTLRFSVVVSGSGRIRASGAKIASVSRTATRAGSYQLRVKLKARYRAQRRAGRKVKTRVVIKFTPAFGRSVTSKLTRTAER